jgi:hypothetical protein
MNIRHPLTIAGIITLVLLAGLLLILFSPWARPETPAVKLPELQDRLPEQTGAAIPRELVQVEVNPQTVQSVIATLARPESYSRSIRVTTYWEGGSSTSLIRVWVKNDRTRMNILGTGEEKNILMDGETVTLWYGNDVNQVYTYRGNDPYLADRLQRIPTYEDILALDRSAIREAGCTRTDEGEWRILVAAENREFGYLDTYYISLETGLLEAAEQWEGDTRIYAMTAGKADLSAPDDQLLLLPESVS